MAKEFYFTNPTRFQESNIVVFDDFYALPFLILLKFDTLSWVHIYATSDILEYKYDRLIKIWIVVHF